MIDMATNEQTLKWPNALRWGVIGFIIYGVVMSGAIALMRRGDLAVVFGTSKTDEILALALLVASLGTALGQRNLPVSPRTFRNFLIWNATGLSVFALVMLGLHKLAGAQALKALSLSATIALWVGLVLFFFAIVGLLHVAAAHTRIHLLTEDQHEAILDRVRALSYGLFAAAAIGLTLVVMSLAGPGGPLPPMTALFMVGVLIVVRATLGLAMRPLLDELSRALGRETGSSAFYLITIIGGGWSILAQLGFVPAPAPLDWLTLLTVTMFAASFIAAGRHGLLKSR